MTGTNLPTTNAVGRSYLERFVEKTIRVYKTADKPGSGVSRPALERLLKDELVVLGEPDADEPGRPVVVTDLGRAVLGAHLRSTVPAELRSWSASWPEYRPLDMTPPELQPSALADSVPGWAEAAPTPADVQDWAQRQASALVPFEVDEQGRPLHPLGRTGAAGRNLGRWGENSAADPIVVAGYGDQRRVLLITRSDIGVEAISGGMTDPGENAPQTLVRELREETGIDLADHHPVILGKDVVDDWRQTDHAWVSSTSALFQLPAEVTAVAADDAVDAGWWPFGSLDQLEAAISKAGRVLYAAHRPLLSRALEYLNQQ